ncbi:hypothetical protein R8Z50_10900 [Longispora sp. K20-0274]|uniref:hypothetical protein n=1 Tax=Longispora sp. K20-0274 TaxID=3088255 RepID=UPI00399C275E
MSGAAIGLRRPWWAARLLAAVVVLAGFVLLHGMQCEDGMLHHLPTPPAHSTTTTEVSDLAAGPVGPDLSGAVPAVMRVAAADLPAPSDAFMTACLVLLTVVLATVVMLAVVDLVGWPAPIRPRALSPPYRRFVGGPVLAELCISRT